MEVFPPGGWDLARPNITTWASDLEGAVPSKSINRCRDKVFTLGRHIDTLSRVAMYDEEESSGHESEEAAEPAPVEVEEDVGEEDFGYIANEPPVSDSAAFLVR